MASGWASPGCSPTRPPRWPGSNERSGDPANSQRRLLETSPRRGPTTTWPTSCAACSTSAACCSRTVGSHDARRAYRPRRTARSRPAGRGRRTAWRPGSWAASAAYVDGDWDDALRIARRRDDSPPPPAEAALAVGGPAGPRGPRCSAVLDTCARPAQAAGNATVSSLILAGAAAIDLHGDRGDLKAALAAHDDAVDTVSRMWESTYFQARVRLSALMIGQLATAAADASADERAAMTCRGGELAEVAEEAYARGLRRWKVSGPRDRRGSSGCARSWRGCTGRPAASTPRSRRSWSGPGRTRSRRSGRSGTPSSRPGPRPGWPPSCAPPVTRPAPDRS